MNKDIIKDICEHLVLIGFKRNQNGFYIYKNDKLRCSLNGHKIEIADLSTDYVIYRIELLKISKRCHIYELVFANRGSSFKKIDTMLLDKNSITRILIKYGLHEFSKFNRSYKFDRILKNQTALTS